MDLEATQKGLISFWGHTHAHCWLRPAVIPDNITQRFGPALVCDKPNNHIGKQIPKSMNSTILGWETAVDRGKGILTKKVGVPATKNLLDFGSRPWLLPGAPDGIHPLYR